MKKVILILSSALLSLCALAQDKVVSPVIGENDVTFSIYAPQAKDVSVHGSWVDPDDNCYATPNWTSEVVITKMKKDKSGVWSVTIPKPAPELWTYNFYVDGICILDPNNKMVQWDGTRELSILLIEGELTQNFYGATQHGNIEYVWYDSPYLGQERRMMVYTPYGYKDNNKPYPVLYLLHGSMCDETTWDNMALATNIIDNRIQKGECEPMIVVMPNGYASQNAARDRHYANPEHEQPATKDFHRAFTNSLVSDIIPFIEDHYRVIPDKAHRAVSGLSMGGYMTICVGSDYPDVFDYICPMGWGGNDSKEFVDALLGIKNAGYKLYWHASGTADFVYPQAVVLDRVLTENGMPHTFYQKDGGHTWSNWRSFLDQMLPLLFK